MGNSNSVGSSIGDIFYPNNPKRRNRCRELTTDIDFICEEFRKLHAEVEDQRKAMKEKVTKLLQRHGYASVQELEEKIEQVLARDELAKWKNMAKELSTDHEIGYWIFAICGLATLAAGLVAGGLVALGVVAVGVAVTGFSIVTGILAAVAVITAAWESITGEKECAELQEAIKKLVTSRFDAKQQLEKMKVYARWMSHFDAWLNIPIFIERPELFEERMTKDFKEDMEGTNRVAIAKLLVELDSQRGSWTEDDPMFLNVWEIMGVPAPTDLGIGVLLSTAVPAAAVDFEGAVPPAAADFEHGALTRTLHCSWNDVDAGRRTHQMDMRLTVHKDRTNCEAVDTSSGETWLLHAKVYPPLPDMVSLGEVRFRLKNEDTGEVRDDCEIVVEAATAA